MLRIIIYFLFGTLFQNTAISQNYIPYYNLRNEALYYYQQGDYKNADSLLTKAFSKADPFSKDLFLMALVKANLYDSLATVNFIKRSFTGHRSSNTVSIVKREMEIFEKVIEPEELNSLLDSLDIVWKNYVYKFRHDIYIDSLTKKVNALIKLDQKYRSELKEKLPQYQLDSLRRYTDSIVQDRLIKLISESGWPNIDERLNTILIHFDLDNFYKYKDIILNEVKKGNLDPFWYAYMEERIMNIYFGKCVYKIWSIQCDDVDKVIEKRKNIGLSIYFTGPYRNHIRNKCNKNYMY